MLRVLPDGDLRRRSGSSRPVVVDWALRACRMTVAETHVIDVLVSGGNRKQNRVPLLILAYLDLRCRPCPGDPIVVRRILRRCRRVKDVIGVIDPAATRRG